MARERSGDRFAEIEENYSGYEVYDRDYEKIGKVDDLFVDENDQPEYIGVKMGFLGTSSTLIPIELVRINDKRKLVEVKADKDIVKGGPTFGDDREITPQFEQRVLSYYQVQSAPQSPSSAERGAYRTYYYSDAAHDERVDILPGERAESRERSGGRHDASPSARSSGVGRERDSELRDEGEVRVPRVEEELRAGTREREVGAVRVRKRVRTVREQVRVPKRREEVSVERVGPVKGEASEAEIGDEEEFVLPVSEEEVVVEKRPVVKEELRIRKNIVEEEQVVEADVRKEEIDIEGEDTIRRRRRES